LPSLDPLTSKIFTITLQAPHTYIAKISVNSGDADLKYKIYLASWGDTCAPRPEDQPTNAGVDMGSPEVVYVLVANTSYTDALGPSEIVVDVLRIAVEPPEISITANDNLPRAASFDVLSDGTGTFTYKATSTENWLTITQGATGTITANDTTRVSLEVVCEKPYPTIPGVIELEFADQAGNVISGTDVPAGVPVTLTCVRPKYDCADLANVDPFGPVEGTFDLNWSAGGSRPAGGGTVGAQVRHVAAALTGISQFPPSAVTMSGTASIDRRVDYDYGGGNTRTEIDSFHTLNVETCRSQSIVSVDPSRCTYSVAVDILVQGTRTIETTDPNNGTRTTVVNDVCNTAASARYNDIPYATLGFSGSVNLTVDSGDIQLGGSEILMQSLFPDKYKYFSDLPPANFSWSIKPSYYPSAGVPQ
jgi:hypothetical protein